MPATLSLTHLFKELREERHERRIEDLLFDYPYLISPELSSPQRQTKLDAKSRGDLLFILPTKVVVVEIKRGRINVSAFNQICRYLELLKKDHAKVLGFLVGTDIAPVALRKVRASAGRIRFRALGKDIPLDVVICRKCRRARDHKTPRCSTDGSRDIL